MNDQVRKWLDEQQARQRQLLLVIDSLAEPSPIQELFVSDLMQDYVNLYQGTEYADLEGIGPWLVNLSVSQAGQIQPLLDAPERNWGWLASADSIDLSALALHWRARMLIEENGQRALYRLQDNRVIARHLSGLSSEQCVLLMGPLVSALCWDGEAWLAFDNPIPERCDPPFATPWLDLAEPPLVALQIRHHNLLQWLWQQHPAATAELAERVLLDDWLEERLTLAERWQWHTLDKQRFLLQHCLDRDLAADSVWPPHSGETAEQHFHRCQETIDAVEQNRA